MLTNTRNGATPSQAWSGEGVWAHVSAYSHMAVIGVLVGISSSHRDGLCHQVHSLFPAINVPSMQFKGMTVLQCLGGGTARAVFQHLKDNCLLS